MAREASVPSSCGVGLGVPVARRQPAPKRLLHAQGFPRFVAPYRSGAALLVAPSSPHGERPTTPRGDGRSHARHYWACDCGYDVALLLFFRSPVRLVPIVPVIWTILWAPMIPLA